LWRAEPGDGKPRKVPYSARTGARASTTDPSTWSSFDEALAAWQQGGDYAGVGFVFSPDDPYCGVDLDDCIDSEGNLSADARRIVDLLSTYTEVSPSGRGLKLFLRAKLPPGGRRRGKVEMYDAGRFFTVTGLHLAGTPAGVAERQAELEALHAEIFGSPVLRRSRPAIAVRPPAEDADLLAKARSARNGRKFMGLFYRGDLSAYGGDDSAADLALCGLLAFWCGGDAERMDRLFRRSALMREKWDSRRGAITYGERTIAAAMRLRRG
jgi:primase-polymerase (primpol)-like protein